MIFTPNQLAHPQAESIGCEPDYDVWHRLINPTPKNNPLLANTRTSGGHVHISFKVRGKVPAFDDIFIREPVVKACDITIGFPLLFKFPNSKRRQLYGKPGAFRKKVYGIEYRVPDNQWTRTAEDVAWIWTGIEKAFHLVNNYSELMNDLNTDILNLVSYVPSNIEKAQEYIQYILTKFNLINRVPGLSPYQALDSKVIWPAATKINRF